MSFSVILVVLLAALLHSSWNFLVKREEDKHLGMGAVVIGHSPFAVLAILYAPLPDAASLPYLFGGALLHVAYQLFLLNSYRIGDLSQVYPLARGVAPVLVAVISVLILGVTLSWLEMFAILTISIGIISLTLVRQSDGQRNSQATFLALSTGGFIAAYSLVDGLGAREAGTALGFYGYLSLINAVVFILIIWPTRPGFVSAIAGEKWRLSLVGGGASFSAYAMVTWAFTVAPISLVAAMRETSIIFTILLGVLFLKEKMNIAKVFATVLTVLGVVALRINN